VSSARRIGSGAGNVFSQEKRCPFDAAAILSDVWNGAIAFFKVAHQFGFIRLSVPACSFLRLRRFRGTESFSIPPDQQQAKGTPANKSEMVAHSFEPGSRVTDMSEMQSDRIAILLCQNQMSLMQASCIRKSSLHKSLQPMKGRELLSNRS
jgi:hypothetical protein